MFDQTDHQTLLTSISSHFGVDLQLKEMIADRVPVGRLATATLFLTPKKQLWLYIDSKQRLSLGEVQKILSKMGLQAFRFCPPAQQVNYFRDQALEHFKKNFPGKSLQSEFDLIFYKTLVPYSPALVQIQAVRDGLIRIFDADVKDKWRIYKKFNYVRIVWEG